MPPASLARFPSSPPPPPQFIPDLLSRDATTTDRAPSAVTTTKPSSPSHPASRDLHPIGNSKSPADPDSAAAPALPTAN